MYIITSFMGIRLALCQSRSSVGDVGSNLDRIMSIITQTKADVYVFPELFLCGYGAEYKSMECDIQYALDKIKIWCMENDIAVIVGAPSYDAFGMKNSLFFITQKETVRYDKLYLAKFGIYNEKEFIPGKRAMISEFKGMRFGLSICYDLFFPEIYRNYAMNGADVNICISGAAASSKPFFDRILPARSLENVIYTVFVNSIGEYNGNMFAGQSRLVGPLGNTLSETGDQDEVFCVYLDEDVVINARKDRHHLEDLREDIIWVDELKNKLCS